jgi:hypothetical protein
MKSALGLVLGVSFLATVVNCASSGDDTAAGGTGPIAIAGSSSTAGSSVLPTAGTATTGGTGGGDLPAGVPLSPMNGWVAGDSNTLMISGAMFPFGDDTSKMGMTPADFSMSGATACLKGTAAKVDMASTPCSTKMFTPPATDCYGQFWGAAIGLNLNQQIDMTTTLGGTPMPFDASAIKGFAFNITGGMVPTSLRFKVEDASGEFCNPATKPVKLGANSFLFSDLIKECYKPTATAATAETAKSGLIKIAWQVVTNAGGTVPFDYCVADLRALQ